MIEIMLLQKHIQERVSSVSANFDPEAIALPRLFADKPGHRLWRALRLYLSNRARISWFVNGH